MALQDLHRKPPPSLREAPQTPSVIARSTASRGNPQNPQMQCKKYARIYFYPKILE